MWLNSYTRTKKKYIRAIQYLMKIITSVREIPCPNFWEPCKHASNYVMGYKCRTSLGVFMYKVMLLVIHLDRKQNWLSVHLDGGASDSKEISPSYSFFFFFNVSTINYLAISENVLTFFFFHLAIDSNRLYLHIIT